MSQPSSLVTSPLSLKFVSPCAQVQERQLCLINLSSEAISYQVEPNDEQLFEVVPSTGTMKGFGTQELTVLMQPTTLAAPPCRLKVLHVHEASTCFVEWEDALKQMVPISMDGYIEHEEKMRMLTMENDEERDPQQVENPYQPVCSKCCLSRCEPSSGPMQRGFWLIVLLLTAIIALLAARWLLPE